jgi:hypothetical protein
MSPKDYVLTALRSARLQAQQLMLEIDHIGLALRHNIIGPEQAIAMACDIGALEITGAESELPIVAAPATQPEPAEAQPC